MTSLLNSTPDTHFAIWRGATRALVFRNKLNGVYQPFAATLTLRVAIKGVVSFSLGVGTGITLQPHGGVTDAMATILLSEAQSLLIPKGWLSTYELTIGSSGSLSIVTAGSLVGEGQG